jgi:hypothetical protein
LNKADGHVYSQLLDHCTIPRDLPARKGLARVIAASRRHERERASEWCDERECEGEAIVRVMLYIYTGMRPQRGGVLIYGHVYLECTDLKMASTAFLVETSGTRRQYDIQLPVRRLRRSACSREDLLEALSGIVQPVSDVPDDSSRVNE